MPSVHERSDQLEAPRGNGRVLRPGLLLPAPLVSAVWELSGGCLTFHSCGGPLCGGPCVLGTEKAFLSKARSSEAVKEKTVKFDLIKIKISYKTNDTINKAKRQATDCDLKGKEEKNLNVEIFGLSTGRQRRRDDFPEVGVWCRVYPLG